MICFGLGLVSGRMPARSIFWFAVLAPVETILIDWLSTDNTAHSFMAFDGCPCSYPREKQIISQPHLVTVKAQLLGAVRFIWRGFAQEAPEAPRLRGKLTTDLGVVDAILPKPGRCFSQAGHVRGRGNIS